MLRSSRRVTYGFFDGAWGPGFGNKPYRQPWRVDQPTNQKTNQQPNKPTNQATSQNKTKTKTSTSTKLWQNSVQMHASNQNQMVLVASESPCLIPRLKQYQYHGLKQGKNPNQTNTNATLWKLLKSSRDRTKVPKPGKKPFFLKKISLHPWIIWLILGSFRSTCFWRKKIHPKPKTRPKPNQSWTSSNLSSIWLSCFHHTYTNSNSILACIQSKNQTQMSTCYAIKQKIVEKILFYVMLHILCM